MNSVVLVDSQGSCALVRIVRAVRFEPKRNGSKNLTGGTTWSSQSTSTDWLTRTHHWSSPRSKLAYKKPTKATSTRKLRKCPETSGQGSKHRDWTASRWWARWRSQSSLCQHHVITWRGLIPADHEYLGSVAWPCHDCEVAPVWHHDVTNARTCQFFRHLFDRLIVRISTSDLHHRILRKNAIITELIILECSFLLRQYPFLICVFGHFYFFTPWYRRSREASSVKMS